MNSKAQHLHVRTSELEKETLSRAAKVKNMTVSQFVLQASLPLAEEIVNQENATVQTLFRLSAKDWDEFNRLLDEPAREIPELRELLATSAPWEK
jgi:uncharacterized protein (DUF1778 family)